MPVLWRIKTMKLIKSDIIPCRCSVMEALLVKFDIRNLSRYLLPKIPAPTHYTVVPKLIMEWAQASSLMDQNQESYQIWHHSLPMLSDGSTSSEVWYTQPLQISIAKTTSSNPLHCSSQTHNGAGTCQLFDGSKQGSTSNLTLSLANAQWWKHF